MDNDIKPIVYVSTPITGAWGKSASPNYMMDNCMRAIHFTNQLRIYYPEVKYYCPAENDLVVQYLFKDKNVLVKSVLNADKSIINDFCSGLIAYKWEKSKGVDIEIKYAKEELNLPCLEIERLLKDGVENLINNKAKELLLTGFVGSVQKEFDESPKELTIMYNKFFRY